MSGPRKVARILSAGLRAGATPVPRGRFTTVVLAMSLAAGCNPRQIGDDVILPGDTFVPPVWHYTRVPHSFTDRSFNDLVVDSRGNVTIVGQYGVILTNRGPQGTPIDTWREMPSPTQEHLTSIAAIDSGGLFGLDADQGEMFAVGWNGTMLYYHPNPDDLILTDDGTWSLIAGPTGAAFTPVVPVDGACPDYDGDGIPDDGDASGFAGDAPCVNGDTTDCDDNCRESPNGTLRPLADLNFDDCIGPGDGPHPDLARQQMDVDGDGVGTVCDLDDTTLEAADRFVAPLFGVTVGRAGDELRIVAVGGDGALISYVGPSGGAPTFDAATGFTQASAWNAFRQARYRYDNDCPPGTPAGQVCAGAGRPPPSCAALCNPARTDCNCPVDQGQCCDALASTGVGCSDGSCPPAPNACDPASGVCRSLCPDCFRRQDRTLRAVAMGPTTMTVVGASGRIMLGDPAFPDATLLAPTCDITPAKPLDDRPVITAATSMGDAFMVAGSLGGIFMVQPGAGGCATTAPEAPTNGGFLIESRQGSPAVVISDLAATGYMVGVAVGDRGTLLHIRYGGVVAIDLELGLEENLHAVWAGFDPDVGDPAIGNAAHLWVVGAGGTIVRGDYY